MRPRSNVGVALMLWSALFTQAAAEALTPDPSAWRSFAYADLQSPSPATATFAELWRDKVEENNRAYRDRGDRRFIEGNAPATEAHFVIWSAKRSVVVSLLNTATDCTLKELRSSAGATVKLCPLRIAIYDGLLVRILDGGRGCVLETVPEAGPPSPASASSGAYASYDVRTRTIRTGLLIDHEPVDGCSLSIPLQPS